MVRWIAPGRIGFMSTQRRDDRGTRRAETGPGEAGSAWRLQSCMDRTGSCGERLFASRARNLARIAAGETAPLARLPMYEAKKFLRSDPRKQQRFVRLFRIGPPPREPAAMPKPFVDRSSGDPPLLSPIHGARLHRTLPRVPAALSCRTERYDDKGNLYLQHAA